MDKEPRRRKKSLKKINKVDLFMKTLPWRKKLLLKQIAEIDAKTAEVQKEIEMLKKEIEEAKREDQEGEGWKN